VLYMGDHHQVYAVRTRWGWAYKILWELKAKSVPWVALRGRNLRTGQPIWFWTLPDRSATTRDRLRANQSGALPGWRFFAGTIYLPTTGCYQLTVRWERGHWTIPFAFERAP
jgi:hypothetical protein